MKTFFYLDGCPGVTSLCGVKILYIFEAKTADLIRIPRLPIRIELQPILMERAKVFALMAKGYIASREEVTGIPEIYIDMDEQGFATLSEWGFLFLMKTRKALAIKTKGFFAIVSNFKF